MADMKKAALPSAVILLLVALLLGVGVGSTSVSMHEWLHLARWYTGIGTVPESLLPRIEQLDAILVSIRLPRVLACALSGAALALAGAGMQALFRNPLADPSLIGVSAGATMGAVTYLVLGSWVPVLFLTGFAGRWALPLAALCGGLVATLLIYQLARVGRRTHIVHLLLTGIAVNALAAAYVGLMVSIASYGTLREFHFWLLGSFNATGWTEVYALLPFVLVPLAAFPWLAQPLNALLLGEAEARHLGIPVEKLQRFLVLMCAALVGSVIAVAGAIGFVGLIVPHSARLLVGADHRKLLPLAAILGAALLVLADVASRTIAAPAELPIGIVTALLGAPFFLLLLRTRRESLGLS